MTSVLLLVSGPGQKSYTIKCLLNIGWGEEFWGCCHAVLGGSDELEIQGSQVPHPKKWTRPQFAMPAGFFGGPARRGVWHFLSPPPPLSPFLFYLGLTPPQSIGFIHLSLLPFFGCCFNLLEVGSH